MSGTGLDKSSSDVAAEGAILNEMLDIVAKRAALRTFDASEQPMVENSSRSRSNSNNSAANNIVVGDNGRRAFESDVSGGVYWLWFTIVFACILLWYANWANGFIV